MIEGFKNVREYTKSEAPGERQKIAEDIREQRNEARKEKKDLSERINNLLEQTEEHAEKVSEVLQEIEEIESQIEKNKSGWISSLLTHFKTEQLKADLKGKEIKVTDLESEIEAMQSYRVEIEKTLFESRLLDNCRTELDKFYSTQTNEWKAYENDRRECNLKNVAEKYNTVAVHKIADGFVPGGNSPLESHADFETKLQIILSLEPALASSFVKEGVGQKLFGGEGAGVVFSDGEVTSAQIGDAGSNPRSREQRASGDNSKMVSNSIKETIEQLSERQTYSEVAVRRPKVAGMFFSVPSKDDQFQVVFDPNMPSIKKIRTLADKYDLPLYILKDGFFLEDGTEKKVAVEEIKQRKKEVAAADKKRMIEGILEAGIFKTNSPEKYQMASFANGREAYIEINQKMTQEYLEKGNSIRMFHLRDSISYDIGKYGVVKHVTYRDSHYGKENIWAQKIGDSDIQTGYVRVWDGGLLKLNEIQKNITNPGELFVGIREWMKKNGERMENDKNIKPAIGYFLYGMAEQADNMGDVETNVEARKFAEELVPPMNYQTVVAKRIGPDGKFRCTQEDIDNIGK